MVDLGLKLGVFDVTVLGGGKQKVVGSSPVRAINTITNFKPKSIILLFIEVNGMQNGRFRLKIGHSVNHTLSRL